MSTDPEMPDATTTNVRSAGLLNPSFIGLQVAAQGMMRTATEILTLTNGELLTIGCYGQ